VIVDIKQNMHLTIHRGANQIGGSCVELRSGDSRIILDIGMPLSDPEGGKFEFKKYRRLTGPELVKEGILPKVAGLYKWDTENPVDALLISHPHLDHYGFWEYVNPKIPIYLGKTAQKVIELDIMDPGARKKIGDARHYGSGRQNTIGNFKVTPYLVDHAAVDSYALVVKAGAKTVIYSGDLRMNGYLKEATDYFLDHAPKKADRLLLEGTMLGGRSGDESETEEDLARKFTKVFAAAPGIVLVYCSVQNIARIKSIYDAAKETNRTVVTDIYGAEVFNAFWKKDDQDMANIVKKMEVFYPFKLVDMLMQKNPGLVKKKYPKLQIKKPEVKRRGKELVMLVRPKLLDDLIIIGGIEGGDFVYSQWAGYKEEEDTARLLRFVKDKKMSCHEIHTSGHADKKSLKEIEARLDPALVTPIHTQNPEGYKQLGKPVKEMKDGVEEEI
jgi:ribonuclease J